MDVAVVFTPGGQLNYNIWNVVRELLNGEDSRVGAATGVEDLKKVEDAEAVVIGGGPYSVYRKSINRIAEGFLEKVLEQGDSGKPLLGICLGHQLIAKHFGGRIRKGSVGEYSYTSVELNTESTLFQGLPRRIMVWSSHKDEVGKVPPGFRVTAFSRVCRVEAMEHESKPIHSVQFHPEVYETERGSSIIMNFLEAAGIKGVHDYADKYSAAYGAISKQPGGEPVLNAQPQPVSYRRVKRVSRKVGSRVMDRRLLFPVSPVLKPDEFIRRALSFVRNTVGDGRVLLAASGGVDSMIVAELLHRALGNRVWFIHMDTGFMRARESERVSSFIEEKYGNLVYIDASREFLRSMRGLEDAEEKRRMFSRTYFRILEDIASQIEAEYVSQGTIWPDIVESVKVFGKSVVKSQHNVSPPPGFRKMSSLKGVLEPLAGIFKHEERVVAWRLGLPPSIVFRMPFPGPGLSVRNVGVITEDSLMLTEKVNSTVEDCVKQWMLDTYGVPIIIEPPGLHRPWQALGFVCRKGIVECKYKEEIRRIAEGNGVRARSVFLLESRMTGVKGDSRTYERPLVIETSEGLLAHETYERVFLGVTSIPRFRVSRVLFTVSSLRNSGKYVAGFRIVESMHAMTARNMRIPGTLIQEISERLQSIPEVGFVVYDVSNKPSATIEPE